MTADFFIRLESYFFSMYGNTIFELGLFLTAASLYFLGRHYKSSRDIKRARAAIPFMIGVWGTRGKS